MSFKILKVIFVILLLITIGEAGYYFVVLKANTYKIDTFSKNEILTVSPVITGDIFKENGDFYLKQVASSDVYNYILHKGQNPAQNLYLTLEIKGTAKIDYSDDGKKIFLTIQNDQHNKIMSMNLIDSFKFMKMEKGEKVPTTINQIKTGDSILYTMKSDLIDQKKNSNEIIIL